MQNTIEVKNLNKKFGTLHAVKDVTFSVARGDVLGFLGPNGAGKSTTMKMIAGFLEPTSGEVSVCGHDLHRDPIALKAAIGYLPEGAPAYGEMTPTAFLDFVGEVRGLSRARREERIRDVVARIHLETVVHRPIETLSKGFKRRVGLAQAILHDPQVLILDEPTDGLDPNQKHEVRTLIREMASEKAIIISTHILEEVDAICTRCMIIADGRLCFSGTPKELESRSALHNGVYLTMKKDAAAIAKPVLEGLANVAAVEERPAAGGDIRLLVLPKGGQRILGPVSDLVHAAQWEVSELSLDPGRLDEVFRTITLEAVQDQARIRT